MTRFHLDTIDLYQARARSLFAQSAAKLCGVGEQQVSADLLRIIEQLEAARLAMRKNGDEQNQHEVPMTPAERETALQYLKDPKLTECIVADFRKCGLEAGQVRLFVSSRSGGPLDDDDIVRIVCKQPGARVLASMSRRTRCVTPAPLTY